MLRPRPLIVLLLLVMTGVVAYATYRQAGGLLIGASLVFALASWNLGGALRWASLVLYPAAFLFSLALPGARLSLDDLAGALLAVLGLGYLTVTQQAAYEDRHWQARVVRALRGCSERLASAHTPEAIMRAGTEIMEQLQTAPHVAFVAYRDGAPYILAASGQFRAHMDRPLQPSDNDSRSVQADHWVAEQGLSLLPRPERRQYHVAPIEGEAGAPLGLLLLARPGDVPFRQSEKEVVGAFAQLLGAHLGQGQAIGELRDANELTLRALGAALERRDDETGGHTQRVTTLSVRLARRLGWSETQIKALRWGAYLHDLGKIAVPDRILHKPGPLDAEERRAVQRHPMVGYDILQDLHFLPAETLDLVRYHHERWDGGGYPAGLRGHNIPETARLFAIVDVYDALTYPRPYKEAWPMEQALDEIVDQAGRQFDPQYVEAFVRMIRSRDDARLVR